MTLIIVSMLIISYLLIATGHLTRVNKSAIAVFLGTIGWVVYIGWGTDFVMSQHPREYAEYLAGEEPSSNAVKYFIYNEIFLSYVGRAASIVMFLLATMSIIEILNNNGCFDFIQKWIKTNNPKRLLWTITFATFIISANLDNLTTATMMLVIMHSIVQNRRQRMLIGSAIVIAANCGGYDAETDSQPFPVLRYTCYDYLCNDHHTQQHTNVIGHLRVEQDTVWCKEKNHRYTEPIAFAEQRIDTTDDGLRLRAQRLWTCVRPG